MTILPDDRKVDGELDDEIRETLLRHYAANLANVSTEEDALSILAMAADHIHSATRREYEDTADLLLDGEFDVKCDSTRAKVVRAFEVATLRPCIVKFGRAEDVKREADVYSLLKDSGLNFVANEMVIVKLKQRAGGRLDKSTGLKMPIFVSSIAAIPQRANEGLVHKRAMNDIMPCLAYMHGLGLFHMDIKLENILVDTLGQWHLTDYGSCARNTTDKYDITASKKPYDLKSRPPSARYDMILLAVACMDLTVGFLGKNRDFSLKTLRSAVDEQLQDEEFKMFLQTLIA